MLTSDLLRVRIKGEYILPFFAEINEENLYLADVLIDTYMNSVGKKVGELEEKIKDEELRAEEMGYNFKFFRGLKQLLDRRLILNEKENSIDAIKIRSLIFELANKEFNGAVLKEEEKMKIFNIASQKLNIDVKKLEEIFNSVYEEEQIIKSFEKISGEELLKQYNLSLLQTLLFKCRKLFVDLEVSGSEMRKILWQIKKLNLLYLAEKSFLGINLAIDGPASVIKQTERYGTRMAKLIPFLLQAKNWHIRAYINLKIRSKKNRIFKLELSKNNTIGLFPKIIEEEITYDSAIEEDLSRKFYTASNEWQIIREPEPIVSGRSIFIPDFALVSGEKKVYLEIMGFWSEDYIKRKLEKLKNLKDINLILAIDESLGKINLENISDNIQILTYNKKLSIIDILKILKKFS